MDRVESFKETGILTTNKELVMKLSDKKRVSINHRKGQINMRVKLTKAGEKIVKQLEIPEIVRAKFYSIFNDPNEYRVYYRNFDDFKEQISDCCFGC